MIKRFSICLFLIHCIHFVGVSAQEEPLQMQLQIDNLETGFLEPLFYSLVLTNTSAEILEVKKPWTGLFNPQLQLYNEKTRQWEKLYQSDFTDYQKYSVMTRDAIITNHTLFMAPQVKWTSTFTYLFLEGPDDSKKYILEEKKKAKLRAVYFPTLGDKTKTVISNEVEVTIKPYLGKDYNAVNWLLKQPIPHFIFELPLVKRDWGFYQHQDKMAIGEKTKEFVNLFPESTFISWAKLNLAKYYISQASRYYKEPKKAASNLKQAGEILDQLLPKLKRSPPYLQSNFYNLYVEFVDKQLANKTFSSSEQYWEELDKIEEMYDKIEKMFAK